MAHIKACGAPASNNIFKTPKERLDEESWPVGLGVLFLGDERLEDARYHDLCRRREVKITSVSTSGLQGQSMKTS